MMRAQQGFRQTARAMLRMVPAHKEPKHAKAPAKPPLRNAQVKRASPYRPERTPAP